MHLNRPRSPARRALFALAAVSPLVFGTPTLRAQTPPAPAGDDTVEVDGMVRSLPRATVVPTDDASVGAAKEVARLVAVTGLYTTAVAAPNAPAGGVVVRVTAAAEGAGQRVDAVSSKGDPTTHRRSVSAAGAGKNLEMARLADAVIADLTGERSHLSGTLLFTDASAVGERRVRAMLASGADVREISPRGVLARGADVGPGNVVYYAAAAQGDMMRIYAEGKPAPVNVRVPGFLQSVAFTADRIHAAVIAGTSEGGALYRGLLEGTMQQVSVGNGVAFGPTFGPSGELAYAAGPPLGPLRVYVDGKAISPNGAWASAPSFCNKQNHPRVAYMLKQGSSGSVLISALDGSGGVTVGEGLFPACSPDGRSVALVRNTKGGGIYVTGEDGIGAHRIRDGAAAGLRWAPGPPLPPEG